MFRDEKNVERQVQQISRNLKTVNEDERNLICCKIAELYCEIGDHKSATQHVSNYLAVRDDSARAYKLLGQSLQALDRKKTPAEYKCSHETEGRPNDLVLKVCELLADTDVRMAMSRAKYWLGKAERQLPHHPVVFRLKEKLRMVDRPSGNVEDLVALMASELSFGGTDVTLDVRLLHHCMEKNQLEVAYEHALSVEASHAHRDDIIWYQAVCDLLGKCKDSKRFDSTFWMLYVSCLERLAALSLSEQGDGPKKTVLEAAQAVLNFDQSLAEAELNTKFSNDSQFADQMFEHMWGQLNFHLACLLLRKSQQGLCSWSKVGRLCSPLLLCALHTDPPDPTALWVTKLTQQPRAVVNLWYWEASYRCSQAGHVLQDYFQGNTKRHLDEIDKFLTGAWRERLYQKIFVSIVHQQMIKSSHFANYSAPNPPLRLCTRSELKHHDEVSEQVWPGSLHHQVWLGMRSRPHHDNSIISSGPHPHLYSHIFPDLQFPAFNFNSAEADSLSRLDIDAFLNAVVLCASAVVEEQQSSEFRSSGKLPTLPADITKTLCSSAQEKWWTAAYRIYREQEALETEIRESRLVLQRGLQVVRCLDNHGLHPCILVHLARIFQHRVEIAKDMNGEHTHVSALEARCELYWSAAVPLLEKLQNNQAIHSTSTELFDYQGKEMNGRELTNALEEGRRWLVQKYLREKQRKQAIEPLQAFECPEASFQQEKARDRFHLTLDHSRSSVTNPKHPLNSELCDHISEIKNELKCIDPDFSRSGANGNESDQSDDIHSSAYSGDYDEAYTRSTTVHELNTTPRGSDLIPYQRSTPSGPQHRDIWDLSRNCIETESNPERLDSQICHMIHSRDNIMQTIMDQNQKLFDWAKTATEQIKELNKVVTELVKENLRQPTTQVPVSVNPTLEPLPTLPVPMIEPTKNYIPPLLGEASSVNVVITTSDTLPTTLPPVKSTFSFTVPSHQRLGGGPQAVNVPHNYRMTMPLQANIPTTVNFSSVNTTLTNTIPTNVAVTEKSSGNTSILSTSVVANDSNERYVETEHDPIPDFVPVVPLPAEVEIITGEEGETTLYCAKAKLFRFVDNEWKERGVGFVKLLRNADGKVRLLMRRDQVFKICANHLLRSDMELTKLPNNDKALMWVANDFADEEVKLEKLCIKFKNEDEAANFKQHFDTAKASLPESGDTVVQPGRKTDEKLKFTDPSAVVPLTEETTTHIPVFDGCSFKLKSNIKVVKSIDSEASTPKLNEVPKPNIFGAFSCSQPEPKKVVKSIDSEASTPKLNEVPKSNISGAFSFSKTEPKKVVKSIDSGVSTLKLDEVPKPNPFVSFSFTEREPEKVVKSIDSEASTPKLNEVPKSNISGAFSFSKTEPKKVVKSIDSGVSTLKLDEVPKPNPFVSFSFTEREPEKVVKSIDSEASTPKLNEVPKSNISGAFSFSKTEPKKVVKSIDSEASAPKLNKVPKPNIFGAFSCSQPEPKKVVKSIDSEASTPKLNEVPKSNISGAFSFSKTEPKKVVKSIDSGVSTLKLDEVPKPNPFVSFSFTEREPEKVVKSIDSEASTPKLNEVPKSNISGAFSFSKTEPKKVVKSIDSGVSTLKLDEVPKPNPFVSFSFTEREPEKVVKSIDSEASTPKLNEVPKSNISGAFSFSKTEPKKVVKSIDSEASAPKLNKVPKPNIFGAFSCSQPEPKKVVKSIDSEASTPKLNEVPKSNISGAFSFSKTEPKKVVKSIDSGASTLKLDEVPKPNPFVSFSFTEREPEKVVKSIDSEASTPKLNEVPKSNISGAFSFSKTEPKKVVKSIDSEASAPKLNKVPKPNIFGAFSCSQPEPKKVVKSIDSEASTPKLNEVPKSNISGAFSFSKTEPKKVVKSIDSGVSTLKLDEVPKPNPFVSFSFTEREPEKVVKSIDSEASTPKLNEVPKSNISGAFSFSKTEPKKVVKSIDSEASAPKLNEVPKPNIFGAFSCSQPEPKKVVKSIDSEASTPKLNEVPKSNISGAFSFSKTEPKKVVKSIDSGVSTLKLDEVPKPNPFVSFSFTEREPEKVVKSIDSEASTPKLNEVPKSNISGAFSFSKTEPKKVVKSIDSEASAPKLNEVPKPNIFGAFSCSQPEPKKVVKSIDSEASTPKLNEVPKSNIFGAFSFSKPEPKKVVNSIDSEACTPKLNQVPKSSRFASFSFTKPEQNKVAKLDNMLSDQQKNVSNSTINVQKPLKEKSLAKMFKPAAGSWECGDCYTRNGPTEDKWLACKSAAPNVKSNVAQLPPTLTTGPFESTSSVCKSCSQTYHGYNKKCEGCTNNTSATACHTTVAADKVPLSHLFKPPAGSWDTFSTMPPKETISGFNIASSSASTASSTVGIPQNVPNSESSSCAGISDADTTGDSSEPIEPTNTIPKLNSSSDSTSGTSQSEVSQSEAKPFTFGSSEESFDFQFQAKLPEGGEVSEDEVAKSENPYFTPVIPLPDKVDVKTGEENEEVLYSHRAKLFRYESTGKIWKERGLGDIKLLKHRDTGKLRLLMRRDQVLKLCLNHVITNDLEFTPKDDRTWLWYAGDYSEGDISHENFACRFKTAEIAQEFKVAIDRAKVSTSGTTKTPSAVVAPKKIEKSPVTIKKNSFLRRNSSSSDIEIVYETTVTNEEKAVALKLQLPENFYAYKHLPDCSGCRGCKELVATPITENAEVPKPVAISLANDSQKPFSNNGPFGALQSGIFEAPKLSPFGGTWPTVNLTSTNVANIAPFRWTGMTTPPPTVSANTVTTSSKEISFGITPPPVNFAMISSAAAATVFPPKTNISFGLGHCTTWRNTLGQSPLPPTTTTSPQTVLGMQSTFPSKVEYSSQCKLAFGPLSRQINAAPSSNLPNLGSTLAADNKTTNTGTEGTLFKDLKICAPASSTSASGLPISIFGDSEVLSQSKVEYSPKFNLTFGPLSTQNNAAPSSNLPNLRSAPAADNKTTNTGTEGTLFKDLKICAPESLTSASGLPISIFGGSITSGFGSIAATVTNSTGQTESEKPQSFEKSSNSIIGAPAAIVANPVIVESVTNTSVSKKDDPFSFLPSENIATFSTLAAKAPQQPAFQKVNAQTEPEVEERESGEPNGDENQKEDKDELDNASGANNLAATNTFTRPITSRFGSSAASITGQSESEKPELLKESSNPTFGAPAPIPTKPVIVESVTNTSVSKTDNASSLLPTKNVASFFTLTAKAPAETCKPAANFWECRAYNVRNDEARTDCSACESPKVVTVNVSQLPLTLTTEPFDSTPWVCKGCSKTNSGYDKKCEGCGNSTSATAHHTTVTDNKVPPSQLFKPPTGSSDTFSTMPPKETISGFNIASSSASTASSTVGIPQNVPNSESSSCAGIPKCDADTTGNSAKPIEPTNTIPKLNSSSNSSSGTSQSEVSQSEAKPFTLGSSEESSDFQFQAKSPLKTPGGGETSENEVQLRARVT